MPTTDCDCYHELTNMKEMFKKKCFGKSNTGLYKHLILGKAYGSLMFTLHIPHLPFSTCSNAPDSNFTNVLH